MDAQGIFESRGLDPELMAKLGVTVRDGKIGFPYHSRGQLQFWKVRPVTEKKFWLSPAGKPLCLWLLESLQDGVSPSDVLVITEGEYDCAAVIQASGVFAVSVPNGANGRRTKEGSMIADDKAFAYLWGKDEKLIPEVDQFRKIVLAVDNDEPGEILRDELAMRIGRGRCWFVTYPEGCKDANDVLLKFGEAELRRVIDDAKPMAPGHLVPLGDVPPRKLEDVYSSGWEYLDKHMMLVRPSLMVITGTPGHGKSQWVRSLCANLAMRNGLRTAFFVREDPAHRVQRDLMRFALRYSPGYGGNRWEEAREWVNAHFMISTFPEDEVPTSQVLFEEMDAAALLYNCQNFVTDPFNEIIDDIGRESETSYIGRFLANLKARGRKNNLSNMIVAHPSKGGGEKPNLYAISGSAHWKNKADIGVIVSRISRDDGSLTDMSKIEIEKTKDHETMGVPGSVIVTFNRNICDYELGDASVYVPQEHDEVENIGRWTDDKEH